jgi:isoleucyl-tRNA synthetase
MNKEGNPVGVKFNRNLVENIGSEIVRNQVGSTHLESEEIMRIGDHLITNFTPYYKLFWNCQHFTRMLMQLVVYKNNREEASKMFSSDEHIVSTLTRVLPGGHYTAGITERVVKNKTAAVVSNLDPEFLAIIDFLQSKNQ